MQILSCVTHSFQYSLTDKRIWHIIIVKLDKEVIDNETILNRPLL